MNTAHRIADGFRSVISYWTPASTVSQFIQRGTLTPAEFIDAGNQLTFKFPTWKWQQVCEPRRQVSWLPPDKQYLVTYGVACRSRVRDLDTKLLAEATEQLGSDGDPWILPAAGQEEEPAPPPVVPAAPAVAAVGGESAGAATASASNGGGKADEDFDDVIVLEEESSRAGGDVDASSSLRSYDLLVTYDKYYQTPRLWLRGFSNAGIPLSANEVLEDILSDYVAKTVTVDPNPCTGELTVSLHPCQHAAMMKKVVDGWIAQGFTPRHDLALIVFLKFIASVIPTIQYDLTVDIPGFSL